MGGPVAQDDVVGFAGADDRVLAVECNRVAEIGQIVPSLRIETLGLRPTGPRIVVDVDGTGTPAADRVLLGMTMIVFPSMATAACRIRRGSPCRTPARPPPRPTGCRCSETRRPRRNWRRCRPSLARRRRSGRQRWLRSSRIDRRPSRRRRATAAQEPRLCRCCGRRRRCRHPGPWRCRRPRRRRPPRFLRSPRRCRTDRWRRRWGPPAAAPRPSRCPDCGKHRRRRSTTSPAHRPWRRRSPGCLEPPPRCQTHRIRRSGSRRALRPRGGSRSFADRWHRRRKPRRRSERAGCRSTNRRKHGCR